MTYPDTQKVADAVVGLTEGTASEALEDLGYEVRIFSRDGRGQMKTDDARMNRINLTVECSVVKRVWVG